MSLPSRVRAALVAASVAIASAAIAEDTDEAALLGADDTAAVPSEGIGVMPRRVAEVALEVRNQPLPDRIAAISELFLDRPYHADPLGEGVPPDAEPLARYDAFDCLTLVEEVLALALAGDPVHASDIRTSLRYGGAERTYPNRRHFMELEWIPGAIRDGWLRDTTRSYGETVRMQKTVTRDTWARWNKRALFAMPDDALPTGEMALDVLTIDAAEQAAERIRPGSLLLTARTDRAGVPVWVNHLGLVVGGTRNTLRHASRMKAAQRVVDNPVAWYVDHLRTYVNWPAVGVIVLEPIEPGPRLAALPGPVSAQGERAP